MLAALELRRSGVGVVFLRGRHHRGARVLLQLGCAERELERALVVTCIARELNGAMNPDDGVVGIAPKTFCSMTKRVGDVAGVRLQNRRNAHGSTIRLD